MQAIDPIDDPASEPARINETVLELAGAERTTYVWAHTCYVPDCGCRTALLVATDAGRPAAYAQGQIARQAYDKGSAEVAPLLDHADHFFVDIDTASVAWMRPDGEMYLDPQISPFAQQIDGDLLEALGRLWLRGKDLEDPEERMLQRKEIDIRGWQPGKWVAWDDLKLAVRRDVYASGGKLYEAHELYCPNPKCDCGEASIVFSNAGKTTGPGQVMLSGSEAPRLVPNKRGGPALNRLWAAFQRRHPKYRARMERREKVMKILGARFVSGAQEPA